MFKVLIVDDEILTRANIKMLLDWEKNGYTICGEASNGFEAIKLIEELSPDIVLSDIRMPKMDGLELSEVLNKKYINIKIVLLSNYDDFDYVRSALKYGAIDYVLKHTLNREVLLDTLNRAKEKCLQDGRNNGLNLDLYNNISALKGKFVLQLITGFYKNNEEIKQHIELLDMHLESNNIIPIVMVIDNYKMMVSKDTLKDISLLEFSIINIADEILNENKNGIISHTMGEYFVILVSFKNIRSQAQIDTKINTLLQTISAYLGKYLDISVSFGIGKACNNYISISESYESTKDSLKNKFFSGKNSIIRTFVNQNIHQDLSGLSLTVEKQIIACLKSNNYNELLLILNQLFENISVSKMSVTGAKMVFNDLLGIIIRTCKEESIELKTLFDSTLAPIDLLSSLETLDEMKKWTLTIFRKLIEMVGTNTLAPCSIHIKEAVSYIKKHYTEDISLSDVANELKIGHTYLSKQFKDELGICFVDYVNYLRLENAKEILKEGKTDIKELISKCGFNNYDYFFKVFKKKTGLTPKEYMVSNKR